MKKDQTKKPEPKNKFKKLIIILAAIIIIFSALAVFYPEKSATGREISFNYLKEIILIFPAVLVLMGLADVWIPQEKVEKYLGNNSGLKGLILSIFMGALPTGPVFIAFPLASELLNKGASTMNIIVLLGAWGSLKIPQIGVEIHFLGIEFAFYRVMLTLAGIIAIGFFTSLLTNPKANQDIVTDNNVDY
ncbi:MAG: permease [Halarsenatibacteraceae bacterium]